MENRFDRLLVFVLNSCLLLRFRRNFFFDISKKITTPDDICSPSTRSRSLRALEIPATSTSRNWGRTRFNRASFTRANGTEGRVRRQLTEELKGISTRLDRFGGEGTRTLSAICINHCAHVESCIPSRRRGLRATSPPRSRGTRLIVRDVSIIYHASSFARERTLN